MNFPLQLRFKIVAIAPQIEVLDASGQLAYYVRQKAFKLKESVTVFADREQTRPLYRIAADRVFDVSAQYHFEEAGGARLGAVKRRGMRSLWKAHYEILHLDHHAMTIEEENPWTKLLDSLIGQIPLVEILTGYILHPTYRVVRPGGPVLLRARKEPAFFEGRYSIHREQGLEPAEETLAVLSLLMMILLERRRG